MKTKGFVSDHPVAVLPMDDHDVFGEYSMADVADDATLPDATSERRWTYWPTSASKYPLPASTTLYDNATGCRKRVLLMNESAMERDVRMGLLARAYMQTRLTDASCMISGLRITRLPPSPSAAPHITYSGYRLADTRRYPPRTITSQTATGPYAEDGLMDSLRAVIEDEDSHYEDDTVSPINPAQLLCSDHIVGMADDLSRYLRSAILHTFGGGPTMTIGCEVRILEVVGQSRDNEIHARVDVVYNNKSTNVTLCLTPAMRVSPHAVISGMALLLGEAMRGSISTSADQQTSSDPSHDNSILLRALIVHVEEAAKRVMTDYRCMFVFDKATIEAHPNSHLMTIRVPVHEEWPYNGEWAGDEQLETVSADIRRDQFMAWSYGTSAATTQIAENVCQTLRTAVEVHGVGFEFVKRLTDTIDQARSAVDGLMQRYSSFSQVSPQHMDHVEGVMAFSRHALAEAGFTREEVYDAVVAACRAYAEAHNVYPEDVKTLLEEENSPPPGTLKAAYFDTLVTYANYLHRYALYRGEIASNFELSDKTIDAQPVRKKTGVLAKRKRRIRTGGV